MLWNISMLSCVILLIIYLRYQQGKIQDQQQQHLQDVDENKRLKKTLERRNLRLDVITQSMSEAVFRLNKSGDVLMLNMKAETVFAQNLGLELPQPIQVFYRHHEWLSRLHGALMQLPQTSLLQDIELNEKIYSARIVALGQQQALLIFFDVSHERTQDVQQNQFLQNLMHDMKTPLTNILAYAGAIRDFGDDPTIRTESLNAITTASQRLHALLESLLTLERIPHTSHQATTCSVFDVWQEAKAHLSKQLKQHNLTVKEKLDTNACVMMHKHDLFRIMSNVVENIVFHASQGKKIDVCLTLQQPFWVLSVRDYGYGLSDADMPRVVERFFKVSQSREGTQQGHGLGLAIVQETLSHYQGKLVLKNAVPQGLIVELHLREA